MTKLFKNRNNVNIISKDKRLFDGHEVINEIQVYLGVRILKNYLKITDKYVIFV